PHRPGSRGCRPCIQEPRTGRESVRVVERPRTADPTDPSPPRGPCPRARPDLHARLLPHLASESRVETPVVHRRAPPRPPRSSPESRPLSHRTSEVCRHFLPVLRLSMALWRGFRAWRLENV